ncbi:XRE family transcriptional regulator [Pedobacter lusitanus]|uniref:XRE family transcriptional regulator n=1 Tax=Pedobacter lusitanus TaxID=1503925 RepID=UPI00126A4ACA|nr:XRE family transcriptional regulator [Pedobacter lusitanus]
MPRISSSAFTSRRQQNHWTLQRSEASPSVDVAKKIADALEVSLDYLAGSSDKVSVDKQTLKLIDEIDELDPVVKEKLFFLANTVIRDAKTGKA